MIHGVTKPVCIVTGAGRGIGRQAARQLAAAGYHVVAVSRTVGQLTATAAGDNRLESSPKDSDQKAVDAIFPMPADVSQSESVRQLINDVEGRFGRIDAAVHCAGVAPQVALADMTDTQWREVIDTNLSSAFYLLREAWPIMKRGGAGGVFVNISSMAARDPFAGLGAYAAAKAALHLLGLAGTREGSTDGIRIHTIAPGAVETDMLRKLVSKEQLPGESCMQPQEVARVIVQCVTGELKHTAGEVIWMHK